MGTPRVPPCVPRPVQLRHTCPLSGEAYVARSAWRDARLATCPRHPRGGCGLVRHGTYPRRTPTGMRIARYYCPTAHENFSLLPGVSPPVLDAQKDIRDWGLLESSLAQPKPTFGGADLHPTMVDKAAALGFALVANHAFVDCNKRIGHASMEVFLILNDYEIEASVDEQERLMLDVAA